MAKRKKSKRTKNDKAQVTNQEAQAASDEIQVVSDDVRAINDETQVVSDGVQPAGDDARAVSEIQSDSGEGQADSDEAQVSLECPNEEAPIEAAPAAESEPIPDPIPGDPADVWAEDRGDAVEASSETEESGVDPDVWAESTEPVDGADVPAGEFAPTGDESGEGEPVVLDASQMESIIESLLFASDKALGLPDLKRLLSERDGKKITTVVEALIERRKGSGIEVVRLANGWHLRTNPEHARWVSRLLAGKPMRLSRAMMETLAIVAYRQPITRPEIDDIRGVDCGPVLKTLLDRGLIRIIGKKEDVGRPLLYGTTPEFLRVFSLRELTDLPTLREYAELSSEQQARVDAEHGSAEETGAASAEGTPAAETASAAAAGPNLGFVPRSQLPDEPEENDPLLDELESATKVASKILGAVNEPAAEPAAEPEPSSPSTPPTEPTQDS